MFGYKMMFLPILISLLSQNVMAGAIMEIASTNRLPFHEITLDTEGTYDLDVDFDGMNERIIADEYSNVTVLKRNMHICVAVPILVYCGLIYLCYV